MAKSNNIKDFKEGSLYPSNFENPNILFPEMEFKRDKGNWISNHHLNGIQDKAKKYSTYIYADTKSRIRDHATGEWEYITDFYMKLHGFGEEQFREALEEMAKKLNLTSPYIDDKGYREQKQKQDNTKTSLKAFTTALWNDTPEAKQVLDYLHSRGFTDDEIKRAEFGVATEAIINTLPKHDEFNSPIGKTHTLVIPFWSVSEVIGFKVRALKDDEQIKAIGRYRNTKGLEKGKNLFSLCRGDETIVLVEGELDAIMANLRGENIPHVVATAGGAISPAQLDEALKNGVKRIILLYDNDEAGRKYTFEKKLDKKGKLISEEGTIPLCERRGIPTFVATFPADSNDVNDFFLKGHTKEEFTKLVNSARPSYLYRYSLIVKKYADIYDERVKAQQGKDDGEEPTLTHLERDSFLFEVGQIVNSPSIMGNAGNREVIFTELERAEESLQFETDGVRNYFNDQYFKKLEEIHLQEIATERKEILLRGGEEANNLTIAGKEAEAARKMIETGETILLQNKEPEYAKVFTPLSPNEYRKTLAELKEGIPTGYCFKKGKRREALTFNVGLTFICGLPSHGKTTFLNNIALNEVKRQLHIQNNGGTPQSVLYFSYEIDKRRLIASLLNTYVNDPELSEKPLATIYNYYQNDDNAQYFKGGRDGKHFTEFVKKEEEFMFNYLSSGLLTIVDEAYTVESLLEAIKYRLNTISRPVSLICIDYAQQIYSETARSKARYEEIKKIVTDIKNFANKEGLPFVLAAQFNRNEVNSPVSVDIYNIGEGGDYARIADTCIGLYNLKALHTPKDKTEREDLARLLNRGANPIIIKDLVSQAKDEHGNPQVIEDYDEWTKTLEPKEGVLFVRLMKRRYGEFPLDAFLKWEGSTGYIEQNDMEHFLSEPIQAGLFQEGEDEQGQNNTGGGEVKASTDASITDDAPDDLPF